MKTKNNAILLIALCLVGITLLNSCGKEWLDIKPKGRFTEEDLPSGSLEGQVFAAYAGLRSEATSGLPYVAVHNIRSDDVHLGSNSGDYASAGPIYDDFNYPLSHWLTNSYWTGHYALINSANNVIAAVDSLGTLEEATLVNIGEAKFLRGWAYFNLVRTFGEVPLIDFRIVDQASANKPKSTIAEIYQLIDADLQEAVSVLPETWPNHPGRLTRGAALAVQTKTFMARQRFSEALASANAVINSGIYDLSVPYNMIFREESENSKESIFEIQALADGVQNFGVTYASRQGVRGSGQWDLGWGWNIPHQRMLDAFEEGDPRKDVTVLYSGQRNEPYGEVLPADLPRAYWNKKVYTNPNLRVQYGSRYGNWFNVRIIRYSDIVLLAAEAANEVGGEANIDLALEYLEQVRGRARGTNSLVLPTVTTRNQAELREAIRHERQVELGMENERFFDLVRWGIDVETMHAAGHINYQVRNRFFPIPQPEIDRSDGILIQNPNY
ncbi:RagB/SusD family nutrient uptake outer membrane protein [Sphingobacterium alkalisoli]|uniref:RagB/SusD family nutrient uptake outer membrane protein n=1 Tax=Sphingobacterium alkalisoli TaxID=1874115 RepID=A0A4U0H2L4_9SPHI|nr:RagB/SusD family nutrient uptake outer membrane protein [Sphingobacterium alkalisoli]TJY65881.1 RagB/SusD family nutrient uptake outer membrane protein [Sphingobacterium alkalisoli]GGH17686.1 membrane protein [Sphingobacterium alkalisoli]